MRSFEKTYAVQQSIFELHCLTQFAWLQVSSMMENMSPEQMQQMAAATGQPGECRAGLRHVS